MPCGAGFTEFFEHLSMPCIDETALTIRLSRGDERAFGQLYGQYSGVAYCFVLSFVKDSQTAKDIVHDAFVKVWLKRESLARVASFSAYLFRMLRNAITDHFEARVINSRYVAETLRTADDFSDITIAEISFDELQMIIFDAVSNMPQRRREVFRLSRYQNVDNREIAVRLGIDLRTVENHLSAALADIRTKITESYI